MIPPIIYGASEGLLDEAVLRRLAAHVGVTVEAIYGKNGKNALLQSIPDYNHAAQFERWAILIDLDQENCVVETRDQWLPNPAPYMCFRIAIREIESWLIADQQSLAAFLAISFVRVPLKPESIENPKQTMVNLARQSRKRAIRQDMVPGPGSGREVGPAYTSRLIEFALNQWQPDEASQTADSLMRCIRCLKYLANLQISDPKMPLK